MADLLKSHRQGGSQLTGKLGTFVDQTLQTGLAGAAEVRAAAHQLRDGPFRPEVIDSAGGRGGYEVAEDALAAVTARMQSGVEKLRDFADRVKHMHRTPAIADVLFQGDTSEYHHVLSKFVPEYVTAIERMILRTPVELPPQPATTNWADVIEQLAAARGMPPGKTTL